MTNEYYIRSYHAASWLHCNNIKPTKITKSPKGYRLFFYEKEEVEELLTQYYENELIQNFVKNGLIPFKTLMYNETDK